jgi:hypothetical protein
MTNRRDFRARRMPRGNATASAPSFESRAQRLALSCVDLKERSDRGPRQLQLGSLRLFHSNRRRSPGNHGTGSAPRPPSMRVTIPRASCGVDISPNAPGIIPSCASA